MQKNKKRAHWENIYRIKNTTTDVSWYQDNPCTSIDLILSTQINKNGNIIDVGGGDSKLVDKLLKLGFKNVLVLDISAKALEKAQKRLGQKAKFVTWIVSDILQFDSKRRFNIWHDRATFHFLTKRHDIISYVDIAENSIEANGYLIISTFSLKGPKKCSGLDISRYSQDAIKQVFKKSFRSIKSFEETHITPFETKQNFLWTVFKKIN